MPLYTVCVVNMDTKFYVEAFDPEGSSPMNMI